MLDAIGLTLDLFADGDAPKERDDAMSQTRGPVTLGVMWGANGALEPLRQHFAGTAEGPVAEPQPIQFCGVTALSLTIETPDRGTVTGKTRQGKGIYNRLVARVHRIVALERRGTPVLVRWVVDLDARDAHRALEDHFFDSVTCAD